MWPATLCYIHFVYHTMFMYRLIGCIVICMLWYICSTGISGCAKEYSFEGAAADSVTDSIPVIDSPTKAAIKFPECAGCAGMDDFIMNKWSFRNDSSFVCGNITDAIVTPERNAFTFFGPSSCSEDTGLIITVYLNYGYLDADRTNVVTNHVIVRCYDNAVEKDIYASTQELGFTLIIDSYTQSTGIAKGRFFGNVKTKDTDVAFIKDGKFEILVE